MKKATTLFLLLLLALSACGKNPTQTPSEETQPAKTAAQTAELPADARYTPGTYEGEGTGYTGPICVSVTVDDAHILSVTVQNSDEGKLGEKVFGDLTPLLLENNTPDVDAVSGATVTSTGFKEAVRDALRKAVIQ